MIDQESDSERLATIKDSPDLDVPEFQRNDDEKDEEEVLRAREYLFKDCEV